MNYTRLSLMWIVIVKDVTDSQPNMVKSTCVSLHVFGA